MAENTWLNGEASFAYAANAALGISLSRQKNAPLDVSSIFKSTKDMLYYVTEGRYPANGTGVSESVKNMPLYPYLGQIVILVNTEASTENAEIYYIKTAESLDFTGNLTDAGVFEHYFGAVGIGTSSTNPIVTLQTQAEEFVSSQDIASIAYDSVNSSLTVTLRSGESTTINGSSSTGDVQGPSSSTNNSIVLFDGTSGTALKDSGSTIVTSISDSDANSTNIPSAGAVINYIGTLSNALQLRLNGRL